MFKLALALLTLVSLSAVGANISASQIQQFKSLPQAQQQAIAGQFGVDLKGGTQNQGDATASTKQSETIQTRDEAKTADKRTTIVSGGLGGLPLFGYDLFSGKPTSYTPIDDLPVPNNYLIAAGDVINVQLFGSQNSTYSLSVSRDGSIQFPALGPIYVAGQTFDELKKNLTNRVQKQVLGVDVSISLGALRTMQVYVAGDVYQSGAYNIPSLATVSQAIIAAGGFKTSGSMRDISVFRDGKEIVNLDFYDLLMKGKNSGDIRLQSGDTIFVPSKENSVSIYGQVRRPAIYELKPGENLGQLLSYAGGERVTALLKQVEIQRPEENGVRLLTLNLNDSSAAGFKLKDGDAVRLSSVSSNLKDIVILRGAVAHPGVRSFTPGMRLTDLFVNSGDDLLPNTDRDYTLVIRTLDDGKVDVLQLNLAKAFTDLNGKDNLLLQDGDQVMVFSSNLNVSAWQTPTAGSSAAKQAASFSPTGGTRESVSIDPETGIALVNSRVSKLSLGELTTGEDARDPYGRETMLAPLLERLKQQATSDSGSRVVEVRGPVKYPGVYPLVRGGSLKDVIQAAGGLLESAALDKAELTRAVVSNSKVTLQHQTFALDKALNSPFVLQSKDRITVQKKANWTLDNVVEIQGEVVHPGSYSIAKGETLSDLIKRAGGMTPYAYAEAAVFSRNVLRLQEEQRLKVMKASLKQEIASLALRRQSTTAGYAASPSEALSVVDELSSVTAIGRLVISLPDILAGDEASDVMLENGDKLYIPPQRNTISVLGQVQLASNFVFKPGQTVDDLILLSGGAKKQADLDRIYIIRANGSVVLPSQSYWFKRKNKPLEPGDSVVVPIDTDYLDGLSTLSTATQIMYQIGVAWSAIK